MLKLIQRMFIGLVLIAATSSFSHGQKCSRIVVHGPDTCLLIPQGYTNSANFIKAAMDGEKLTHNQLVLQVKELKLQRDTLRAQKQAFRHGLDTCRKVNTDLADKNAKLYAANEKAAKNLNRLKYLSFGLTVALVIETLILISR